MKKGFKYLLLVLMLAVAPCVKAATAGVSLSGTNSIKVGETTTIYVKISASSLFKGVDLTYGVSGNISLVGVDTAGGMKEQDNRNNRALLYSSSGLSSGSAVYAITVKGTAEGTGSVSVSGVEVSVNTDDGLETAVAGSDSITITVNPVKTQAEIAAEKEAQARAQAEREAQAKAKAEKDAKAKEEADAKAKAEAEAKAKEDAKKIEEAKKALNKAQLLVKAAEKSLARDDYEAAVKAVNALDDSSEKTALLERLEKLKFDIAVHEACGSYKEDTNGSEKNDSVKWIVLSVILLLLTIAEFIYIAVMKKREERF